MKIADKKKALQLITNNKLQFFNEYKAILEEECEIYADDDYSSFMLVQNYPYGLFASIIGFSDVFFDNCLSYLKKSYNSINIAISMPPSQTPNITNQDKLISKGVYKAFAGNDTSISTQKSILPSSIRLLTEYDENLVVFFKEEIHSNMIRLDVAFNDLVLNNNGEIYGYINNNQEIIGYLSCCHEVDNIWDVIYIYVQPEYRLSGIGTQLAKYYLYAKLRDGQIPYYSGVSNPASEAAAVKAGFALCGERFSYEYHC